MKSIPEVLAKIWAWVEGKETELSKANENISTLTLEKAGLDSTIIELTNKNSQAATELQTAKDRVSALEKDCATKDGEIAELKKNQTTVKEEGSKEAQKLLAGQGVPAGQLPAGVPAIGNVEAQVAALRAKLPTADAKEKFRIANQIRDLLSPPAAAATSTK